MPSAVLDISVLVRYLTKDDPAKADAARSLIASQPDGALLLPDVAITELGWVLLRVYRWPIPEVARALRAVVTHKSIEVAAPRLWLDIADDLEQGHDLVDAYLQRIALHAGISRLVTFDADMRPIGGVSCQSP
jgi:predicted nucleic acid-binding protein